MKLFVLILLRFNLFSMEVTIDKSLSIKEIQDIEKNILNIESTKNISNIWKDPLNNLTWEDNTHEITQLSFQEASDYCKKLTLKSFTDWRLPTSDELNSLINYSNEVPQTRDGLKYISNIAYISSTKYHKQNWSTPALTSVYLDNGSVDYYLTNLGHLLSVRCVR